MQTSWPWPATADASRLCSTSSSWLRPTNAAISPAWPRPCCSCPVRRYAGWIASPALTTRSSLNRRSRNGLAAALQRGDQALARVNRDLDAEGRALLHGQPLQRLADGQRRVGRSLRRVLRRLEAEDG